MHNFSLGIEISFHMHNFSLGVETCEFVQKGVRGHLRSEICLQVIVSFDSVENFKEYMESHEKIMEDKFVQV